MSKIRVGIIGTGGISVMHLNAYRAHPLVEIAALCDIQENLLKQRGIEYNVPSQHLYTDYHEMLQNEHLDAVSVCTWNSEHAPCTIAALETGSHVLCEKPMAITTDEAKKMKEVAKQKNKILMIGFVRRFSDNYEILKEFITKGDLGDIYHAKAFYLRRKGSPGSWFGDKTRAGGGPLIDLGVHVVDLTRSLMGNPKPISVYGATFYKLGARDDIRTQFQYRASGATAHDRFDVEDFCTAMIRYENGTVVSLDTSYSLNIKENISRLELYGTNAGAKLETELEIYGKWNGYMTNVGFASHVVQPMDEIFKKEINHFISCVAKQSKCAIDPEDGIILMQTLEAIYRSAETGHEVLIS